jgi:hypothetical protein
MKVSGNLIQGCICLLLLGACTRLQKADSPADQKADSPAEQKASVVGSEVNLDTITREMNVSLAGSKSSVTPSPLSKIPTSRQELSDMRTVVKVYNRENLGNLNVPGFGGLKLGANEQSLSIYYIETKPVINGIDTAVYGIGYSVHYLFKKVKRGISLTKLPFIAASVQLDGNKTEVYYSLHSHGMIGLPLVKFFRPVVNKPFDVEGFGIMQASMDGVQNTMSDETLSKLLRFAPQRFASIKLSDL